MQHPPLGCEVIAPLRVEATAALDRAGELLRVRSEYCADDDSHGRSNHDTDPDPDSILGEGEHHYAEDNAESGPESGLVEESRSVVTPFVPAS